MLIAINSLLLSITTAAFLIISFFLKDLYKDFKGQIEKTNALHAQLHVHVKLFQELTQIFRHQIEDLNRRMDRLEREVKYTLPGKKE